MTHNMPDEFIQYAEQVKGKRAKLVIKLLLEKGTVTTDDLEKAGYIHPPRAIRDVRENGIPLETFRVKGENGKLIAAYKFGDPSKIDMNKLGGRKTFSKSFKAELYDLQGGRCAICNEEYDPIYLQIDHRIPYEFMADTDVLATANFMLLCATCNRKKDRATAIGCSKTCFTTNDPEIIRSCYWATPENYTHICMKPIRHSEITWSGDSEVKLYDQLQKEADKNSLTLPDYIKSKLQS
jgi:hypothetical protein